MRKSKHLQVRVPRLLLPRESPCTSEPQCLSDDPTRAESCPCPMPPGSPNRSGIDSAERVLTRARFVTGRGAFLQRFNSSNLSLPRAVSFGWFKLNELGRCCCRNI